MEYRKQQLIEHFIAKCSMAIEEANKVADMNCELYDALCSHNVRFVFEKKDGTMRDAYGTMRYDITTPLIGTGRPLSFDLQLYFDLDKMAWRSFKKANLISFQICE